MPSQAVQDIAELMAPAKRMTKGAKRKPAKTTGAMGTPKKKAAPKATKRKTAKKTKK